MKRVILVFGLVFAVFSTLLSAQLTELTDESAFSESRIRLAFWAYHARFSGPSPPTGAEASDVLAAWGIDISSGPRTQARIGLWNDRAYHPIPPPGVPVVQNRGIPPFDSANSPLIINFNRPALRIGLVLHGGVSGFDPQLPLSIRISAFDAQGAPLGEIQREGFDETEGTLFLGVESEAGKPISKVVLDYGDVPNFEEIAAIIVDFQQVPKFVSCLPQIGDGPLPNGSLRFSVSITNIGNEVATGALSLKNSGGEDLALELNGTRGSEFPFALPAYETLRLSSSGNLPEAVRGYALVESDGPVLVSENFQVLDAEGNVVQEAGLDAESPEEAVFAPVSRHLGEGLDTGVALANLTDSEIDVIASMLVDGPEGFYRWIFRTLMPGEQMSVFLDELLNSPGQTLPDDLDATLRIQSSGEIAVTVLKTVQGVVSASLPVGTPQQRR